MTGRICSAKAAASCWLRSDPAVQPPSFVPRALAAARPSFVRLLISIRSFCARAAKRCRTNGSTSAPLRHEAGNEMHVAGEAVELAHNDRPAELARSLDGGGELRPAIEGVGALARLVLLEGLANGKALGLGEGGDRVALRFEAEAAPGLALRAHPHIGDRVPVLVLTAPSPVIAQALVMPH